VTSAYRTRRIVHPDGAPDVVVVDLQGAWRVSRGKERYEGLDLPALLARILRVPNPSAELVTVLSTLVRATDGWAVVQHSDDERLPRNARIPTL
jgi:hypothetical protein